MKPSWKEILAIFVLAVLATGGSLIYEREVFVDCPQKFADWCTLSGRGWPFTYTAITGYIDKAREWNLIPLFIDFAFYSIVIFLFWSVGKFLLAKIRS